MNIAVWGAGSTGDGLCPGMSALEIGDEMSALASGASRERQLIHWEAQASDENGCCMELVNWSQPGSPQTWTLE